jgi:hypothetical protein
VTRVVLPAHPPLDVTVVFATLRNLLFPQIAEKKGKTGPFGSIKRTLNPQVRKETKYKCYKAVAVHCAKEEVSFVEV